MHKPLSRSSKTKHQERSLDDFLRHIRQCNLRSERHQRHFSPSPFYMYQRRQPTLQRSRTVSLQSKSKKSHLNRKVSSILTFKKTAETNIENPADRIDFFSRRIREAQKCMDGKSRLGTLLCTKFLQILNFIVENMVNNLQHNLMELEVSAGDRIRRDIHAKADAKVQAIKRKMQRMERRANQILEKENYNSNLIYRLRLNNVDIDREFSKFAFQTDRRGGYRDIDPQSHPQSLPHSEEEENLEQIQEEDGEEIEDRVLKGKAIGRRKKGELDHESPLDRDRRIWTEM